VLVLLSIVSFLFSRFKNAKVKIFLPISCNFAKKIMSLITEFENSGNWLFKHRSYVPLFLYVLVIPILLFTETDFISYENLWWAALCFAVSLLGQLTRALTIGLTPANTSGRNTKAGQVAEQLNTKGMYSIVRHPLYFGNFLMWLGIILYVGRLEFLIFAVFFFWIYYERIMFAEERFISKKFEDEFFNWAAKTPAFFPKLTGYKKAHVSFSVKNILKREYHGLYATVVSFTMVYLIKQYAQKQAFEIELPWVLFFSIGTLVYLIIRLIVKTTKWLHVKGR
jgi:lipid A Kdo2 1-phosphate O-methyltransferase